MEFLKRLVNSGKSRLSGFYYGYVIVLCSFCILILTHGTSYSFGVFFKPLADDFGITRAVTSGAFSLYTLLSGFWGIVIGKLTDKFGARITVTICGFLLGSGYFLMSQVSNIWQIYLYYTVITAIGMGGSWPSLISNVTKWFVEKRGLTIGIVASGGGLGLMLIPAFANLLISNYDWRFSYLVLGISAGCLIILLAQFLKHNSPEIRQLESSAQGSGINVHASEYQSLSYKEILKTSSFWLVCVIYFCTGMIQLSLMVHIVPHATDLGFSASDAAYILVLIGVGSISGRILVGTASDKIGARLSIFFTFVLVLAILLLLLVAKSLLLLYLFGLVFGIGYGGLFAVQTILAANLFGYTLLATVVGSITFAYTTGGTIGPIITGYIFDSFGNYQLAFIMYAMFAVIAIVMTVLLKP
jgi:MFS family permease